MMRRRLPWALALLLAAPAALADSVVPTRTIRAHTVIRAADVTLQPLQPPRGFAHPGDVIGQEARVALYPGRPILAGDIGPPALVERNQIVQLIFRGTTLRITTEGRALERGGVGDRVRVMNLASRATLFAAIQPDGSLRVDR